MKMISFCLLTVLFLFIKSAEPQPRMMSIHGDVDFVVKTTTFGYDSIVGFMYDDVDGTFALNPSFCSSNYRGSRAFKTYSDCSVISLHARYHDLNLYGGFDRIFEPNFPAQDTGSNLLIGLYDDDSPYTATFSFDGAAFRFEDINQDLSYNENIIQCNNKDETYYTSLFIPNPYIRGQMNFNGTSVDMYDRTLKCVAELRNRYSAFLTGRLFILTITNALHVPFTFRTSRLSADLATLEPKGASGNQIAKVETATKTKFVFRATSMGDCDGRITMEINGVDHYALSFNYDGQRTTMPAILAGDSLICGIQRKETKYFTYWCDCVGATV